MADRIADPWGLRTPYGPPVMTGQAAPSPAGRRGDLPPDVQERRSSWPVRVDTFLEEGVREKDVEAWVQAASILHSNGDAMDIAVAGGRIVGVRGRAVDRINHGRLDPKDLYGWQANNSPDRLRRPLVREGGRLVESDWDTAMGRIVARSRELLDGPGGWGHGVAGGGRPVRGRDRHPDAVAAHPDETGRPPGPGRRPVTARPARAARGPAPV